MPTFAELINANPQQVQDLLDMAKASEAAKAAASLREEAQVGQEMLAKLKETSEAPAEYAGKKAKALAKSAKSAMGQVGEGVISDLPQTTGRMAAASEKAARAAAGTIGEGVIPMSGQTPSFLQRIASLAEKGGASVLEKLGVSGEALSSLASKSAPVLKTGAKIGAKAVLPLAIAGEVAFTPSAGANSDVTPNKQISKQEMDYLASEGKPIDYSIDSDEKTLKSSPRQTASSKFDSAEQIRSDVQKQPLNPSYLKAVDDELFQKDAYLNMLKTRSDMVPEEKARLWDAYLAQNSDETIQKRSLEKASEIDSDKAELKNKIGDLEQKISENKNPFAQDGLIKQLAQLNNRLQSYEPSFGGAGASRMTAAPSSQMSPEVEEMLSQPSSGQPAPIAPPVSEKPSAIEPKARTVSAGETTAAQVTKEARQEELAKVVGEQAAKQIAEQEDLLARFKQAQERQRTAQLGVGLTQAAERIGSSIAMVKPGDQAPYEQAMKLASGITDEFKDEFAMATEAEKRDPKSAISKTYQNLVKSMGIAITGNESAEALTKALPFLQQYQSQKENREARAEARIEKEKDREALKELRKEEKLGSWVTDARRYATTGDIGKVRGRLIKAENSIELFDKYSKDDPTGAKDLAGFFGFMKGVQQDDSVIREAEARLGLSLGSLSSRMKARMASFLRGEMFSPEQRQQMVEVLKIQRDQLKKEYTNDLRPLYEDLKVQPGMTNKDAKNEFKRITSLDLNFDEEPSEKSKSGKSTIKLAQKLSGKAGKTFTDNKTGKKYIVNPDETSATEL